MAQMSTRKRTFLFVNKSGNEFEHSPHEFTDMMKHVSTSHRAWLKQQRLYHLQTTSAIASRGSTATQDHINKNDVPIIVYEHQGIDGDRPPKGLIGSTQSEASRTTPRQCVKISEQWTPGNNSHGPFPVLVSFKGNSDPFAAAAIGLGPQSAAALNAASSFLVFPASSQPLQSMLRVQFEDKQNAEIHLKQNISHRAELHAILAAGYIVQANTLPSPSQAKTRVLFHKTQALAHFRSQLGRCIDLAESVTLINLLLSLDVAAREYTSAQSHLQSLLAISQKSLDHNPAFGLIFRNCDYWLAITLVKQPLLYHDLHDPGDLWGQTWASQTVIETAMRDQDFDFYDDSNVLRQFDPCLHWLLCSIRQSAVLAMAAATSSGIDSSIRKNLMQWSATKTPLMVFAIIEQYGKNIELAARAADTMDAAILKVRAATAMSEIAYAGICFQINPSAQELGLAVCSVESLLCTCVDQLRKADSSVNKVLTWVCFINAMAEDVCASKGQKAYSGQSLLKAQHMFNKLQAFDLAAKRALLSSVGYIGGYMDDFLDAFQSTPLILQDAPMLSWNQWQSIFLRYMSGW